MRLSRAYAGTSLLLTMLSVVGVLCVVRAQPQPPQDQLTVYTAQTSYPVPVLNRDGRDYVGLAELLGPLGRVRSSLDGRKWKLRFNEREAQFTLEKTKARIEKQDVPLPLPPIVENGRGLVSLSALPAILNQLAPGHDANLHEQSRRLFLDKAALRYTAELRKSAPSQLVVTFTAPVNPSIATEQGKLRMLFRREPVVPTTGLETLRFNDNLMASLSCSESNGTAELTVSGTAPLTASFSPDRKVITITAVRLQEPAALPAPAMPASVPQLPASSPAAPAFIVVIDPAHGGDDPGSTITDKVLEKEVTLKFARALYRELDSRGISARLVRDGDTAITPEQRAVMTNSTTPSLFVTLHASSASTGVHVFTSRLKPALRTSTFIPWNTAQSAYVALSQQVAASIATELLKHDVPGVALSASLQPLNNIAAPAAAIEVARPTNGDALTSPQYEQLVCSSIAAAIANSRARLPQGGAGH